MKQVFTDAFRKRIQDQADQFGENVVLVIKVVSISARLFQEPVVHLRIALETQDGMEIWYIDEPVLLKSGGALNLDGGLRYPIQQLIELKGSL